MRTIEYLIFKPERLFTSTALQPDSTVAVNPQDSHLFFANKEDSFLPGYKNTRYFELAPLPTTTPENDIPRLLEDLLPEVIIQMKQIGGRTDKRPGTKKIQKFIAEIMKKKTSIGDDTYHTWGELPGWQMDPNKQESWIVHVAHTQDTIHIAFQPLEVNNDDDRHPEKHPIFPLPKVKKINTVIQPALHEPISSPQQHRENLRKSYQQNKYKLIETPSKIIVGDESLVLTLSELMLPEGSKHIAILPNSTVKGDFVPDPKNPHTNLPNTISISKITEGFGYIYVGVAHKETEKDENGNDKFTYHVAEVPVFSVTPKVEAKPTKEISPTPENKPEALPTNGTIYRAPHGTHSHDINTRTPKKRVTPERKGHRRIERAYKNRPQTRRNQPGGKSGWKKTI